MNDKIKAAHDQMTEKLAALGIGFEEIRAFGAVRTNVHVVCISSKTAKDWAMALAVLSNCLPMEGSGFTPSDAGRALAAVDELAAAAKKMNLLAKGPPGGVSRAEKRAVIKRMDAALAPFGGAS